MEGFITGLTGSVTSASLWAELAPVAAFVGLMVLFAFGYSRVRRVATGASKGKAKV